MSDRIVPNGYCWCGCGEETTLGKFFVKGHNRTAQQALDRLQGGDDLVHRLLAAGYGPDRSVVQAAAGMEAEQHV